MWGSESKLLPRIKPRSITQLLEHERIVALR